MGRHQWAVRPVSGTRFARVSEMAVRLASLITLFEQLVMASLYQDTFNSQFFLSPKIIC